MLLYRGDHLRNARGFPQKIEGGAEAIQQAMIRLSVPKGSFTLDEELGSRLHTLGNMASICQLQTGGVRGTVFCFFLGVHRCTAAGTL